MCPPSEPFFSRAGGRGQSRAQIVRFLGLHTVTSHELSTNTCMYYSKHFNTHVSQYHILLFGRPSVYLSQLQSHRNTCTKWRIIGCLESKSGAMFRDHWSKFWSDAFVTGTARTQIKGQGVIWSTQIKWPQRKKSCISFLMSRGSLFHGPPEDILYTLSLDWENVYSTLPPLKFHNDHLVQHCIQWSFKPLDQNNDLRVY